jgi:hypothetical protein
LAPRRQRGSPFSIKQAPDLSQGKKKTTHKLTMAEESQPTKRHKTLETHTQHDFPQESPNEDDLDSQIPIPTGEDEQKQIPLDDYDSDKDGNTSHDSDARKSLDDFLFSITKDLPDIKSRHNLLSANMLGVIDKLEDSRTKYQAGQFFMRSLNKAISRIQDSITSVEAEIVDLQNNVSKQKDAAC